MNDPGEKPAEERRDSGSDGNGSEQVRGGSAREPASGSTRAEDGASERKASDSEPVKVAASDSNARDSTSTTPPEPVDDQPPESASKRAGDQVTEADPEALAKLATEAESGSATDTAAARGTRRGRARRWKHRIALGLILPIACATFGYAAYELATWPDIDRLATERPETTAFIDRYRERQREAGRPAEPSWRWVPYSQISPHLKRAVVAAEDISFFFHEGFDLAEIEMAIRDALAGRRSLRGASTISQQLAKNLWLSPSRNPWRKLKEAALTRQLERTLSKHRVLALYLNVVEFGPGIYGAEAAARHYFGKSAAELSEWEAAQLAASLPRPSRWNPRSESRAYWSYVEDILRRLEKAEFLWRYIPPDETGEG